MQSQAELFESPALRTPAGFRYEPDFLTAPEEAELIERIAAMPLAQARYKSYTARRRVASFGGQYDYDHNRLLEGPPIDPVLLPLRARVAAFAGIEPEQFAHALVAEYRPGTPLGWHRDVPDFEIVAGVSLASAARMRLRRYPPVNVKRDEVIALMLEPRSAYLIEGEARWGWQHSISPTPALRYSITFRTRRRRTG